MQNDKEHTDVIFLEHRRKRSDAPNFVPNVSKEMSEMLQDAWEKPANWPTSKVDHLRKQLI